MVVRGSKAFFSSRVSRLNKGYEKDKVNKFSGGIGKLDKILPPIEVISQYEEIYPGTLEKLIEIANKDQQNRYSISRKIIKSKARGKFFGHICRVVSLFIVCFFFLQLVNKGFIWSGICLLGSYVFITLFLFTIKICFGGRKTFSSAKKKFR